MIWHPIMYADDATVKALADGVAAELNDGWTVETWQREGSRTHQYLIVKGDLRILIHHKTHGDCARNQLTFTGLSPRAELGTYGCDRGSYIQTKMTRPPHAVTSRLVKELLPRYTRETTETLQSDQRAAQRASEAARLAQTFAERLPSARVRPPGLFPDHRSIGFGHPDGPHGVFDIYSDDDGLSLGVEFGMAKASDPEFVDELLTLLSKHYS
ncbi:hypothetical protein [Nonomuraea sp. SYSU D8015]|uniref:hypothetical protein n=1 Tax=Nonomuraea sp. SYSU D8015 TaxID=2593644 RepID=UPI001660E6E9|nr:hypothetical protein [Nonomuraea sp. SYSU D8015]